MKIFSSLLLFGTMCYTIVGYYVVFEVQQHKIREEMKCERLEEKNLITLRIPNNEKQTLEWHNENEFSYQGSLYDVAHSDHKDDTTYYYCVNDTKEVSLITSVHNHIERFITETGTQPKNSKISLRSTIDDFCFSTIETSLNVRTHRIVLAKNIFASSLALEVVSPPPKA